jgi:hypothetical protein
MAALLSTSGAFVVDGSGGSSPMLTVDLMGVCNLVSRMGGGVRMMIMCLFLSFARVRVVFGVVCDWVNLRLSLARCLRRMALFLSARMSLLIVFGPKHVGGLFGHWVEWCFGWEEAGGNT